MRAVNHCLATICAATAIALTPIRSAAQDTIYDYATGTRATRMWIPPGLETIRGIFIYGNGAGGDSRDEVNLPWNRVFAYNQGFAMIATSMWGNLSGSEINIWDSHLSGLAALSGHPELVYAPWAPIGFSNGGQMSYGFNALRPDKTIAFVTNKGCCYNIPLPSVAALTTPGILIAGELDTILRRNNIKALFDNNRPRGALWSWVEQEGEAHSGRADAIILPFIAEAIRLRYPAGQLPSATQGVTLNSLIESSGWLSDQSTWKSGLTEIEAYEDYPDDRREAGWLLNERMAFVYRAFSTYDRDTTLSFDLDFPFKLEAWFGRAPEPLTLTLDLTAATNWTHFTLYNYSQPVLQLNRDSVIESLLTLSVPIPRGGSYAFSALITHDDGHISTTNSLAYYAVAIPEPGGLIIVGVVALLLMVVPCRSHCDSAIQ